MPASTLEPVDAALRAALNKNGNSSNSVDIGTKAKRALLVDIEFESAGSYQSTTLDKLKTKYVVLKNTDNSQTGKTENDNENGHNNNNINGDCDDGEDVLKLPKYELYPSEAVQLGWSKCDWSIGAGMINMGNTCYLNSTLQALFHVPALVNWLISDKEHSQECLDAGGFCIICAMRKTLLDSQQRNSTTIRPLLIYNKLRLLCRNLIPGRQEDAHEFLRYLIEAMEKSYLNRFKNFNEFDMKIKETTPLHQILGGYLRSAVRCLKCGYVSTTFQHFQDLLLDIRKSQTLDEALDGYFAREKLDDDSYHCQSCQKQVPATKQFFLERSPMVLCIQLKRFSISNSKITKPIQFRQRLDLTKFARHRPNVPLIYRLVALVTHMGPTVNCGHYTAVAQAPNGNFYQYDDSMVRLISHQAVFNTNAYIMFYELESSPFAQKTISTTNTITNNNGIKSPLLSPEKIVINSNYLITKPSDGGIGYTSDKIYGPELPPERKFNGNNINDDNDQIRINTSSIINNSMKISSNDTAVNDSLKLPNNGVPTTCNGTRPQFNKETNNERREGRKRPLQDNSDDPVRIKHQKLNNSVKSNPVQEFRGINGNNNNNNQTPRINTSSVINGNGKRYSDDSSSDSEINQKKKKIIQVKILDNENKLPVINQKLQNRNNLLLTNQKLKTNQLIKPKTTSPPTLILLSTSSSSSSSLKQTKIQTITKLVPYETDDSSNYSSDSNNSINEINGKGIPTKVANVEWKIIQKQDVLPIQKNNNNIEIKTVSDDTINELLKMSHNGYSAPVTTWNGARSQLDKEINNERRDDKKRSLQDNGEEQQIRIKLQKINNDSYKSNPGYNPVQEFQNMKNWNRNGNPGGHYNKHFYSANNRHRRNNFHHKNYQKKYRFRQ